MFHSFGKQCTEQEFRTTQLTLLTLYPNFTPKLNMLFLMKKYCLFAFHFFANLFFCTSLFAQIPPNSAPPKIFINCSDYVCYEDYLKTELSFFDFVRDRFEADVQLLIIAQENGAGGQSYTVNFLGQNKFKNQTDTLIFSTKQADTEDMIRQQLVKTIKQGLVAYILQTNYKDKIEIAFPKREAQAAMIKQDKWNYWVFNTNMDMWLNGETNRTSISVSGTLSANRITPKSKFMSSFNYGENHNSYTIDTTNFSAITAYSYGNVLYVRSINEKWSVGGIYQGFHSVFRNIQWSNKFAPAIEYNIFPNGENTRRQFRWIYQAGGVQQSYMEETIFEKKDELLPYHQLTGVLIFTQPWGSLQTVLNGSQYLHDSSKYRLGLDVNISWRVFEGFQMGIYGNFTVINDQISLAKSTIDTSVFLLNGRQLPTNMSYYSSINVSYTFGSINNSVVNPRFNNLDL
jgi:hypothetical protein